jgi:hypothetical protein
MMRLEARQIFRALIDMAADVTVREREVTVRFHRRAHLPIVLASGLIDQPVPVPWCGTACRCAWWNRPRALG